MPFTTQSAISSIPAKCAAQFISSVRLRHALSRDMSLQISTCDALLAGLINSSISLLVRGMAYGTASAFSRREHKHDKLESSDLQRLSAQPQLPLLGHSQTVGSTFNVQHLQSD